MFPARYAFVTVPEPKPDVSLTICGLVLAAGAGTRFGGPKALASNLEGTPWLELAVRMLQDAGCASVVVALGAGADAAAQRVPPAATIIVVPDWSVGLSASLRAGLDAAAGAAADAVLVTPVDTPEAPASAARRVIDAASPAGRAGLARAAYEGVPGHPVFIGADHFASVAATLVGDHGAGPYLRDQDAVQVECGDLWSGADVDHR
ncbi:molybdenum cofactor cytidylyltransferase [Microbacterium pygmaeum]|uniref:Molybdenum cofactor cytidylyltransferase n=1 Tax=Microbacterium pygmaeum TaxID=370764 RepID=A0A1G7UDJ0_9MICO|nr:molybdenum cofactor cytidylyltransferase [Microbacterium pygmaeum]